MLVVTPEGDKGILAYPVALKECRLGIKRKEFRGIYGMERGSTGVGFERNLEPMTFVILT